MNNAPVENPFFRWVRGLGVQRSGNRWIGGVAGGLGQRFGIDPILARGIVLVLAVFTGIGLLLYGLAWALLPEPDGRIHAQEAGRGRWTGGMTGALVFFLLGTFGRPGPFDGWYGDSRWDSWWGGTFWILVIIGGAIWLSVASGKRRGDDLLPAGPEATADPSGGGPTGYPASGAPFPSSPAAPSAFHGASNDADGGDMGAQGTEPIDGSPTTPIDTSHGTYPTTPIYAVQGEPRRSTSGFAPYSAPLDSGTAPYTAHAPHGAPVQTPPPAHQAPERTGNPLPGYAAAVVLGVAILVAGSTVLASMLGWIDLGGHAAAVAMAAALTVIGFGLVGAALRRHSGGALTGFAIFLLVPTLLFGGAAVNRAADGPWLGPIQVREGNEYTYVFSSSTLDLSRLGESLQADTTVTINNVFSSLDLTVPDNVPVVIQGASAFYSMEVTSDSGTANYSGIGSDDGVRVNPGAAGPTLTIEINGAFNSVKVATKEVAP